MTMTWEDHARRLGLDPTTLAPKADTPETLTKYRNRRTRYGGRTYASAREAERAADLDTMTTAGIVTWWYPQPQVFLGPGRVPYRPDFLVIDGDGFHFEDVKGHATQRARDIARLWAAHGPAPLVIIYANRHQIISPIHAGPSPSL